MKRRCITTARCQRRQSVTKTRLTHLEKAQALDPALPHLDMLRAEALGLLNPP